MNASTAMAPFRGSRMAGQISQTAPPSAPLTSSLPSPAHGGLGGLEPEKPGMGLDPTLEPSRKLSSSPVLMIGVPSRLVPLIEASADRDRKSTRLNSSHLGISY